MLPDPGRLSCAHRVPGMPLPIVQAIAGAGCPLLMLLRGCSAAWGATAASPPALGASSRCMDSRRKPNTHTVSALEQAQHGAGRARRGTRSKLMLRATLVNSLPAVRAPHQLHPSPSMRPLEAHAQVRPHERERAALPRHVGLLRGGSRHPEGDHAPRARRGRLHRLPRLPHIQVGCLSAHHGPGARRARHQDHGLGR
jgi:hypothetical protein